MSCVISFSYKLSTLVKVMLTNIFSVFPLLRCDTDCPASFSLIEPMDPFFIPL